MSHNRKARIIHSKILKKMKANLDLAFHVNEYKHAELNKLFPFARNSCVIYFISNTNSLNKTRIYLSQIFLKWNIMMRVLENVIFGSKTSTKHF